MLQQKEYSCYTNKYIMIYGWHLNWCLTILYSTKYILSFRLRCMVFLLLLKNHHGISATFITTQMFRKIYPLMHVDEWTTKWCYLADILIWNDTLTISSPYLGTFRVGVFLSCIETVSDITVIISLLYCVLHWYLNNFMYSKVIHHFHFQHQLQHYKW